MTTRGVHGPVQNKHPPLIKYLTAFDRFHIIDEARVREIKLVKKS